MTARATIVALASGRPPSAIAIVRVSGPGAFEASRVLVGRLPSSRRAALRAVRRPDGVLLDRALVLAFAGPASATGEDIVELHLHGGQAVIAAVIEAVTDIPGVRLAEPGEFTRRAFDNGRLDLTQVEGLADLLAATTEAQRAQAVTTSEGALAKAAAAWRSVALAALIETEAQIDFADEDDVAATADLHGIEQVTNEMAAALAGATNAERVREGLTVVLLGPPNSGKSSLLNALAGRDAAIVSAIAGTTRDPVTIDLDFCGVPATLIDTAGLRASDDPVEAEGIARALFRAEAADLLLRVGGARGAETGWPVHTMIDLTGEMPGERGGTSYVSALTGAGIGVLRQRLTEWATTMIPNREAVLVSHARQRRELNDATVQLRRAISETDDVLRAEALRLGLRALGRLTGSVDVEEVLGGIFARFCIGK